MAEEELVIALKGLAHPGSLSTVQALTATERKVRQIDELAEIGQPMLPQQLSGLRN